MFRSWVNSRDPVPCYSAVCPLLFPPLREDTRNRVMSTTQRHTLRCFASCLLWIETRSNVLHHVYFGVRHAPPVLHMNALVLIVIFCECSSLLVLRLALSFSVIVRSELVSLLYWLALD